MKTAASILLLLLFAHLELVTAADDKDKVEAAKPNLAVPEEIADGWQTASPTSVGLNTALLGDMFGRIANDSYKNIHSVLVVKNGKLVIEQYYKGRNGDDREQTYTRKSLHTLQSVTKSVNSTLIGIAIDQHLIRGVDEKMSTFFPQYAELFKDNAKAAISLKQCLAMSSGLSWTESGVPYTDPRNDAFGLNRSTDPVRYVFERPVATPAGEKFQYHSGVSIALGEVLHQASGMAVDEFAERHLFGPIGIKDYRWGKLPSGAVHTGGGLWLCSRDMAKIGFLFLNGGRWQDKQIVSENWVRDSTRQQAPYFGYGYQWWLRTFRMRDHAINAFAAQGLGGQFIIVIPDLQMVAVFTGWNMGALTEQPFEMMQRFVLPATETPQPPASTASEK